MIVRVFVALLTILACETAAAQTKGTCANAERIGSTRLQVTEQNSRALVEIERPGGAGQKVEIEYGDELYVSRIGPDNKLQIAFSLMAPSNSFSIRLAETPALNCKIDVPEFKKIYRIVLRWHDPVQLNFHVVEPGGRIGGQGDVASDKPAPAGALGQMDVVGRVPDDGTTAETSFVVPDASVLPEDRPFDLRVEYLTRGMKPALPYCDDGPLASIQMDLIVIDRGVATTASVGTNRLHCGVAVPENRRFMRLEH